MEYQFLGSPGNNSVSIETFSPTQVFNKHFPYYLSIGMTYQQYWEDDNNLVKYYREADEIKKERINQEAWLQGMYVYDAIIRLSPILHAFAKKGTKPKPYVDEPYPINQKMVEADKVKKEKDTSHKVRSMLEAFMVSNNKKFEKKG